MSNFVREIKFIFENIYPARKILFDTFFQLSPSRSVNSIQKNFTAFACPLPRKKKYLDLSGQEFSA